MKENITEPILGTEAGVEEDKHELDMYRSFFASNKMILNPYEEGQNLPRDVVAINIRRLEKMKKDGEITAEEYQRLANEAHEILEPIVDYFEASHSVSKKMNEIRDFIQANISTGSKNIESLTSHFKISYAKFVKFLKDEKNGNVFSRSESVKLLDEFRELIEELQNHESILRSLRPRYGKFIRESGAIIDMGSDTPMSEEMQELLGINSGNKVFDPEKMRAENPEPINKLASKGVASRGFQDNQ